MSPIDVQAFKRDGFVLVRNVFSAPEVAELRNLCYETLGDYEAVGKVDYLPPWKQKKAAFPLGDVLSMPKIRHVVSDARILQIAATLLGCKPTYFGDSTMGIGEGPIGFHKDNVDRDAHGPDWEEPPYGIIRMGIYLQDHSRHSGALKVRVGSHTKPGRSHGKVLFVPTQPGDVVAWYLTTTHSGNSVRLKFAPNLHMPSVLEKRIPAFLKRPDEKERVAIFMTYARPGLHLNHFVEKFTLGREDFRRSVINSPIPETVFSEIAAGGRLDVFKPCPEYGQGVPA